MPQVQLVNSSTTNYNEIETTIEHFIDTGNEDRNLKSCWIVAYSIGIVIDPHDTLSPGNNNKNNVIIIKNHTIITLPTCRIT